MNFEIDGKDVFITLDERYRLGFKHGRDSGIWIGMIISAFTIGITFIVSLHYLNII